MLLHVSLVIGLNLFQLRLLLGRQQLINLMMQLSFFDRHLLLDLRLLLRQGLHLLRIVRALGILVQLGIDLMLLLEQRLQCRLFLLQDGLGLRLLIIGHIQHFGEMIQHVLAHHPGTMHWSWWQGRLTGLRFCQCRSKQHGHSSNHNAKTNRSHGSLLTRIRKKPEFHTPIPTHLPEKRGKKSVNPSKVLSIAECIPDCRLPERQFFTSKTLREWCTMNDSMERILVIDDDVELCHLVGEYLQAEGLSVDSVHDGEAGLKRAIEGEYLLIVLDVMLPGINGFEVLRRIRAVSRRPVLLLTARGEDVDRIVGLEIGADDYLPKPFNPRELVARIRAVLRRTHGDGSGLPAAPEIVRVGDVELDPATRSVRLEGRPVDLTSVEFNLLEVLLREAGRVVPRERLVNAVLSRKFSPFDRSIDMHVSKVRKKLGDTDNDEHIKTVRGVGYIFARPREKAKV